ncbi:MAG: transcriptional regulator PpsR [Devosiaceae bacterium]
MLSPNITRKFDDAANHLGALEAERAADLLSAAADMTLVLNGDGAIIDMAYSASELASEGVDRWINDPLGACVAEDSKTKVELMFGELSSGLVSRRREINFLGESGESLPISCMAVRLADDGRIVLFGRDMRSLAQLQQRLVNTQISMEREYTRLRQAEACYRLLFQIVGEAVLVVDASTMAVTDANPIAADLLDVPVAKIVGRRASHVFGSKDRDALRTLLSTAQSVGRAEAVTVDTGDDSAGLELKASLFRQADVAYILVRLLPRSAAHASAAPEGQAGIMGIIERLPEGFVVLDKQRRVQSANASFLELVQAASDEQVIGKAIDTWFERSSVDASVLLSNVREHGLVRRFPTVLRGEHGSAEDVEITAVSVSNKGDDLYGLVLRRSARSQSEETPITGFPAQSAEQLTDLIGHMPLKEVVRETTDVVERLCIEAALKLTGDNRASAAQMLGVSRQSLYAKMHRFGLGDLATDSDA